MILYLQKDEDDEKKVLVNPQCGDELYELLFGPVELLFVLVFCAYSAWSVYVTTKGLTRKGLNNEIKLLFLRRQITFFIIIIFTQFIGYFLATYQLV